MLWVQVLFYNVPFGQTTSDPGVLSSKYHSKFGQSILALKLVWPTTLQSALSENRAPIITIYYLNICRDRQIMHFFHWKGTGEKYMQMICACDEWDNSDINRIVILLLGIESIYIT